MLTKQLRPITQQHLSPIRSLCGIIKAY